MTTFDLRTDDGLRAAAAAAEARFANPRKLAAIADLLRRVQETPREEWRSKSFFHDLWETDAIASVGQGSIDLDAAYDNDDFRSWFAQRARELVDSPGPNRTAAISSFYYETIARLRSTGVGKRVPHLKILRALAALFPLEFTAIPDRGACKRTARVITGDSRGPVVERHRRIVERLNSVFGAVDPSDLPAVARRLALPWWLFKLLRPDRESRDTGNQKFVIRGPEGLRPRPPRSRPRLSAHAAGIERFHGAMEALREGTTRQALAKLLEKEYPTYAEARVQETITFMQRQLGVMSEDGDRCALTERGRKYLETKDPDAIAEWVLTQSFGGDHLLYVARNAGLLTLEVATTELRHQRPGWTTESSPKLVIDWLVSLGLLTAVEPDTWTLTERGKKWASRIIEPSRPVTTDVENADSAPRVEESPPTAYARPSPGQLYARIQTRGAFPDSLVAALDAGLWADARRHFAILTGLSGAGKTLLARAYAQAITRPRDGETDFLVIPVQPGWHDPMPLLGWVHPLNDATYVRTAFLNLLLRASGRPDAPYVVILDEMNLSHPEQYLAPILSAMETGDALRLHERGAALDGIPPSIPYPSNLVIIGTVNMDETTQGLSDKVLDRAFVHEFWDIDVRSWPDWGSTGLDAAFEAKVIDTLDALGTALKEARLHFGWRTVQAVTGFLQQTQREASSLGADVALDRAIYAKILPKLRGDDSPRFRKALDECERELEQRALVRSAAKVAELRADLDHLGTARFWR